MSYRTIRMTRRYAAAPARVWAAVATSEGLAAWLMPNDFVAREGHAFAFRTDPAPGFDGVVRCTVREIVPGRRVRISWAGGGIDTEVTFDLAPAPGGGTELRLTHGPFRPGDVISRAILGMGWRRLLGRALPAALATVGA